MKKYIVAPDSFKGSISAHCAAAAMENGILSAEPDAQIEKFALADGGEGTLDALTGVNNRFIVTVTGTDGKPVRAEYGFIGDTAVIEMAQAAGLCLVEPLRRNPETATSYGVGELILDALRRGFGKILLTVGGSGTNDGGAGMLEALGARFLAADGSQLIMCGGTLNDIAEIDLSGIDRRIYDCEITLACDVTYSLTGHRGATRVFGAQKGADSAMLDRLETGMIHYAKVLAPGFNTNLSGLGAGGGLPFPLVALFGAKIRPGIEAVFDVTDFRRTVSGASLIITGEGKLDEQSLNGKVVGGVAELARTYGVPVAVITGKSELASETSARYGIVSVLALDDISPSYDYSMSHAAELISALASRLIADGSNDNF